MFLGGILVKVLIADTLPRDVYVPLFQEAGIEYLDEVPKSNLEKVIADCEGLVVRSATKVTAELLANAPKLKIIGRAGTGYDNIDLNAATLRGIVVENTPDANSNSATEYTMGLIYALAKNISAADASLKSGKWEKSRYSGTELHGKRLGIIGLGRIGQLVAKLAMGNGMEVVFYDPYVSEENARKFGYTSLTFDELLRTSDYVTLHAVLTEETKGMIGTRQLSLMKPSARLINAARGELVDEDVLYDAIKSGKLAGAGIDVFEKEPYKGKLLELGDKIVVTPHLAASTEEAQTRVAEAIVNQMILYFKDDTLINAVNTSPFPPELRPYLDLVERMGYFAGWLLQDPITNIKVTCYGEITQMDIRGIDSASLVGLLSRYVDSINIVNAPQIAKQRGIIFSKEASEKQIDYRSMVSLEVLAEGQKKPITISGILFGRRRPRVIELNGYEIEFEPTGNLLLTSHVDVPKVLAYITTTLGENDINIATSHLSRKTQGGSAMAVFSLDSPVPYKVIKELANPERGISDVRQILYGVKVLIHERLPPRS